jgi:hypothetical protein
MLIAIAAVAVASRKNIKSPSKSLEPVHIILGERLPITLWFFLA